MNTVSEATKNHIPSVAGKRDLKKFHPAQEIGPINTLEREVGTLGKSTQWLLIGMYSLICFLMGIVLKPYLYPPEKQVANSRLVKEIRERDKFFLKKHHQLITQLEKYNDSSEQRLDRVMIGLNQANSDQESIKSEVFKIREFLKLTALGESKLRKMGNRGLTIEDTLAKKHSQLLYDLKKDHQQRREKFLAQNEIKSAEGLKAWEDFSRNLLREKKRLNRIIANEKRTFGAR